MSTESQTYNTLGPNSEAQAVAVIGLGALFPGSHPGVAGYWSLVKNGRDAITDIPCDHFLADDYYDPDPKARDKIYCRRGAFIPTILFSPLKYGITPKDLEAIDTTQLLGLVIADEALRDAGYPPEGFDHTKTAVIMGVTGALKMVVSLGSRLVHPQLRRALTECGLDAKTTEAVLERFSSKFPTWSESSFPGLLGNVTAGRVANRLDLGGPNMVVDAACASSLAAVGQALTALRTHKADLVVSGGLDTFSDPFMFSCFSKTPALSPSGEVRSFDRKGDGTLLGEGVGVVILKRLEDALRDGDRIYASIVSVGGSSDGRGTAIFAPSPAGQRRALEAAYLEADWSPQMVELVEAHGTGTAVGDGVELESLANFFSKPKDNASTYPWCALGSVKSQIGHAKGAAGVAGLIKAVLALYHKVLPPTIKVTEPLEPLTKKNFPLFLNDRARPWLSAPDRPRRAAVSAFGFGGSNFHCLLMEAPGPKEPDQPEIHLVPMSAENLDVLKAKLARLISDTDQTKIKTHEVNTSVGQIKSYDAALDVITREFISYFNSQDNLRLVLVGKADEMNQKARSLFDLISFSESTSQPPSLPGAFWGQADHASPALILSLSDLPQSPEIPTQLGSALMDLALTFPIIQEYLDLAEGLRAKRHLSEHNLGLILSPPALAPPEFKEELQSILKSPEMSALVWSLSQLSLVALLKHFGLPILDCQSSGRGLLASLFWASQIEADEALNLSIDLALDDDGLINERLSQISAKGPETSFKLNTKPTPILFGPGGLFDSQSSFLDCLKAVSETSSKEANRVSSPVVILVGNSLELNLLDGSQPLLALAECLAHLTALGLALDLTAWPTWPEEPAPPTGYAVPVGGANLFREPPTFKADPISTDRSSELSDEMLISPNSGSNPSSPISLAISEILNNQRQGLSILKNLALNLETQSPTPQTISRLQSMGSVLGASSVLGVNHGANQGVDQMGGCDLADPFFDHRQILPGLSHLYSQKPDQPTGSSKASGGNGKSNGSGLSSPSSSEEVWDLLTQIVSDETGYPVESLDPDMELENDLGLDSIKKVELLSTLAENFPKLSGAGSNLSQSLTLGQLSQICLAEKQTSGPKTSALKEETFSQDAPSWPTVQPVLENSRLLLFEILSQETGYPVESLSLDMQLENDLGLDSIKKVELLSALTEKFPQTNPRSLSEALTLGQILDLLVIPQGASDQKVPEQGPKSSSGPWAGPRPTVFQVVSAETGYPIDSLCPEMNLEEDLGLDSIKKVEILSLLSESFPAVADPALLSQAKTLGDWQEAFEVPISKTMSSEQQFSTLKPFTYVASQGLAGQTQTSEPGGGNGSGLKLPSGKDILDRMLGTSSRDLSGLETNSQDMSGLETNSQDLPSLWQVEPELFAATDYGACLWPPSGLIRLIGSDPLAKCLEKELQTLGYQVERRSWLFDFSQWKDDGQKPRVLFLVWPGPDRDPTLITQALKALENTGHQAESIIGLSFLGGFFGFPRPGGLTGPLGNSISGALVGLLKCAAQEWPQVNVRVLDLPLALYHSPTPNWISAIMETATCQGPVELGLPQINRVYNLTLKPYSPTISSSPLLEPGDTVVVTGGGRGVTAAVLLALAKLYRPRLIILGRTPLPPPEPEWLRVLASQREIMEALFRLSKGEAGPKELEARATLILASRELSSNLTALNDTGAQIEYISGDFTNSAFIEETARRIRTRYGPIKGFIHGAGVLADHPIIGKNPSDFDRVYATKTLLASILLEAFQPEPLRLMVFFSSTTARFGRHGQGDYAAGNEVLNKTAWEMATLHPNCRVLALNWGPWAAGMVNETLAGQFKSQGLGLIDLKEGCETFLKLIRTPAGGPAEVVVLGRGTSLDILSGYQ